MKRKLALRIIKQTGSNKLRAIEYGLSEHFTVDEWGYVLEQSDGYCVYCTSHVGMDNLVVEHQTALCQGGTNTIDNIVAACKRCNQRKRMRPADDPFPLTVEPCGNDEVYIVASRQRVRLFRSQIPDLVAKLSGYTP